MCIFATIASGLKETVGPVNLNTYVWFKMKPRGVEVAREYWERFTTFPNVCFTVDQPDVAVKQQFHDLFRIFGGQIMRHDMDGSPIYDLVIEQMPG